MKQLQLSKKNKKIFGVCGGIAEYFEVDPTIVRVIWLAITILTGVVPGIIVYLITALIMPS